MSHWPRLPTHWRSWSCGRNVSITSLYPQQWASYLERDGDDVGREEGGDDSGEMHGVGESLVESNRDFFLKEQMGLGIDNDERKQELTEATQILVIYINSQALLRQP